MQYIRIGPFPAVSVAGARGAAAQMDLNAARGMELIPQSSVYTLGDCISGYLKNREERKGLSRSLTISRRRIEKHVPAALLRRTIPQLRRADFEELLFSAAAQISAGSSRAGDGKRSASLLITDIRSAINWAIKQELIPNRNPAAGVELFAAKERDRFLSEAEVRRFFAALEGFSEDFRDLVRLLIFTGKRRENIAGMRWEWVRWENRSFIIPEEAEKTDHADGTFLCDEALQILTRRRGDQIREHRLGEFVFPSPKSRSGHYSEPSSSWRRLCAVAKLEDLRIHDLRRTLGSWAAERNYSLHTIADMLGHSSTAATHIYARIPSQRKREAVADVAGAIARAGGIAPDPIADARRKVIAAMRSDPEIAVFLAEQINKTQKKCVY
jgi:integrase